MGFFDGLESSLSIIKDTLSLTAKNPVLLESTKYALAFSILHFIVLVALLFTNFPLFIAFVILSIFLVTFVGNYLASAHSYVVYKIARHEKPLFQTGLDRARQNLSDVAYLTVVEIIVGAIKASLKRRGGRSPLMMVIGIFFRALATLIEEGFDLFENFVIPSMINTEKTFWESLGDLQKLRGKLTESVVGVLGFDFVAGVFNSILFFTLVVLAVLTVLLFGLGGATLIVIGILIILGILAASVIGLLASFAKSTYFTLLWMELHEPKSLKNPDLAGFLKRTKEKVAGAKRRA